MKSRVAVVMPAFNAGRTLRRTYEALPREQIDSIILVDDGSTDETVEIARELGLHVFVHDRNYGYGANQKTCYREALRTGAAVIAMVHPDYQYDPSLLPSVIEPILQGSADIVLGSRLMRESPVKQGMPWWKYVANRGLTWLENVTFGLRLSEYHTGYRAYRREFLESVNFASNSDRFLFDQEILAQAVAASARITEVPVPTRYFPEASSVRFLTGVRYGFGILWLLARFVAHRRGWVRQPQFDILVRRYRGTDAASEARPETAGV